MNGKKAIFSLLVLALLGIYGVFVPLESGSFQQENGEIQKVIVTSVFDNYQINPELQTGWGFGTVSRSLIALPRTGAPRWWFTPVDAGNPAASADYTLVGI